MMPVRTSPVFRMQPRPMRYNAFVSRDWWIAVAVILFVLGATVWRIMS